MGNDANSWHSLFFCCSCHDLSVTGTGENEHTFCIPSPYFSSPVSAESLGVCQSCNNNLLNWSLQCCSQLERFCKYSDIWLGFPTFYNLKWIGWGVCSFESVLVLFVFTHSDHSTSCRCLKALTSAILTCFLISLLLPLPTFCAFAALMSFSLTI